MIVMENAAKLSLEVGKSSPWQTATCVHALLSQARRTPDATALRGPKSDIDGTYRELSYAELVWNAHELMKGMVFHLMKGKKDALKGKAIAIFLPRDVDFVVSMLACFFCGATYVPLSDTLPPDRIAYILQDSEAIGVITCSDASISNSLSQAVDVFSSSKQGKCPPPSMMHDWVDNYFWSSQPHRKEFNPSKDLHKHLVLPEPHDVAYMIYTSGTTGNPKGVEIEHHSMLNVIFSHVAMGSVTIEDMRQSVCVAAFIFDSHVREVWMPLVWGGCTCIAKDVLHLTEGAMSAGTPTGLIAATASNFFPSTIKTVMAGGEALTETLVQSLGQKGVKKIINAYGPTETVIECMTWKLDGINSTSRITEDTIPIGLPIPNVLAYGVRIADSGTERDPLACKQLLDSKTCMNALAERGSICELYIGGEGVARGYKNREALTSEKFIPDPFSPNGDGRMYQTGDLVVFGNISGEPIQYVGRIDTQVKIRGKRLELGDIKTFVCASDDVKNSEVLVKNYGRKKQLVAYIVWNQSDNDASKEEELIQELEEKMMKRFETLEDYKQPATIVSFPLTIDGTVYHSFPITPGGKVDLTKFPEPEEVKKFPEESFQPSPTSATCTTCSSNSFDLYEEIESNIVKAVQKILQLDSFGPNDDFFKAGLTSMEVPALKFILKQDLNLQQEISTECVFENSSAQDLAAYIANPQNSKNAPTLSEEDFIDSKYVEDEPLPGIVVWFLSTFTAIFAFATSLCFVFFLFLISVEVLHEYGKCNMRVGWDLQNDCDAPDKWMGYWTVALGLPCVLPLCVCLGLVAVAFMKWIVVGRFKPGCYSVDGLYYFRWLYVHHLEVFSIRWLLTALPFRCTFLLNRWLRMMGADIGSNTVIDSLDIHEMCLLTIGPDVTIQNDAMITGHTFAKIRYNDTDLEGAYKKNPSGSKKNVLVLGRCWVKKGATLGPYSMVHPHLSCQKVRKNFGTCTVVDGILPGYQSTSRLGQSIQLDPGMNHSHESLVWTPAITVSGQLEGIITSILLQCIAFDLVLAVMYHFFVPLEATFFTWIGRCYLFFSPWPMGIPFALFAIAYKWTFIGSFKAGQYSSPRLDKYRWILQSLCRSRIQIAFELAGASSEILNMFYRLMGMQVGWNAQVMPLNIVEYDLFKIGNNCSFGGQVMICCRTSDGKHEPCSIGNYSAITNSAGMLAGSTIGNNCLVGNLTLLPPGFSVPNDSKCVGTKFCDGSFIRPVTFSNAREKPGTSKLTSTLMVLSHILGSILIDVVYYTEFVFIALIFTACQKVNAAKIGQMHLVHNPMKVLGGYLLVLATTIIATIISTFTIICIKRSIPKFHGKHERDSILFVIFIWLTKHQMNMESWSYVFNGTPIQSFFYRLLGAEISLSSRLFMRYFIDVDGLVVGEKTILSYDCYLEQHKKTAFKLEFDPLSILKNVIVGQRSIILKNVCVGNDALLYPLSAIAPKETIISEEVRGGILAEPYYMRHHADALDSSAHSLSSKLQRGRFSFGDTFLTRPLRKPAKRKSIEPICQDDVNMIVIGAGVSGIVAAHEFRQKNITVKVLEKSSKIMGCWQTYANQTSHVAVTEATYRLSGTAENCHASDYPSKDEVLAHGYDFFRKHKLDEVTEFGAEVVNIKDVAGTSNQSFKKKHGYCLVTYKKKGQFYKIKCKGVFIATGAQAIRNEFSFPGEESFNGSIAFGSNDLGNAHDLFKGKSVCIVGGGAFALENLKTALTHGAKHVTLVHRNDIQVWPRCVHYLLSSEQNRKFSEYNELYLSIARWAGLSVGAGPSFDIAPFMHPGTSAQPTSSDSFFAFYKAGLVSLVYGTVHHVHKDSISVNHTMLEEGEGNSDSKSISSEIPCDVFLKCVGWKDPGSIVRKIYPQFEYRNFVFLNKSPRVVYVCDPRYRHENQVGAGNYADVLDTVPVGGTYSVPILSRIAATLQLYSLGVPLQSFDTMLESIPTSDQPLCSWIEAKFQYPKAKEISEVVRNVIDKHKRLVTEKHPSIDKFVAMNSDLLKADLEQRNACVDGSAEDIVSYAVDFKDLLLKNRMTS